MKVFIILVLQILVVGYGCKNTTKTSESLSDDSSSSSGASSLSAEEQKVLDQIHQDVLSLKTANQVDPMLAKLQQTAAKHKNFKVVHVYAELLTKLKLFKGIFWRLRTVVDDCAMCHVRAIGLIRVAYLRRHSMGPHFKAILDYLVHPQNDIIAKDKPGGGQFASISDFQKFAERILFSDTEFKGVLPFPVLSLEKSALKVEQLVSQIPKGTKFNFDMRVFAGLNLMSESKQSKTALHANFLQVLARSYRNMGILTYFINYNMDGLSAFFNKMVKVRGLQSLADSLLSGTGFGNAIPLPNTAVELVKILSERSLSSLATLRTGAKSEEYLKKSALYLYKGALMRDAAYDGLKRDIVAGKDSYVTHPSWFDMNSQDVRSAIKQRKQIFGSVVSYFKIPVEGTLSASLDKAVGNKGNNAGIVEIVSNRTGKRLRIRPAALFGVVAQGRFSAHKDLKRFLPAVPNGPYASKTLTAAQKQEMGIAAAAVAWNYEYGKAHNWRDPSMSGLFPEVRNSEQLMNIATEMRMNAGTRRLVSFLPFL